jgi:hypothetical protein
VKQRHKVGASLLVTTSQAGKPSQFNAMLGAGGFDSNPERRRRDSVEIDCIALAHTHNLLHSARHSA